MHCRLTGKFSTAGTTPSDKTKEKIARARKGKKISNQSLSHKSKIGAANMGRSPATKGTTRSEETKRKIGATKKRTEEYKKLFDKCMIDYST